MQQSKPYPQPLKSSFTFPNPNSDRLEKRSSSSTTLNHQQPRKIKEDVSGLNSLVGAVAVLSKSNCNSTFSANKSSQVTISTLSPPSSSSSRGNSPSIGDNTINTTTPPDTSAFKITVGPDSCDADGDSSMTDSGSKKWPSSSMSSTVITGTSDTVTASDDNSGHLKASDSRLGPGGSHHLELRPTSTGTTPTPTSGSVRPSSSHRGSQPDPTLISLLGPGTTGWNYSDKSLIQALQLKAEQEKTKQEFYRLEIWQRSLELIKDAISYNVPPNAIPVLFQSINGAVNPGSIPASVAAAGGAVGQTSTAVAAAAAAAAAASVGSSISVDTSPKHEPVHLSNIPPSVKADKSALASAISLGDRERFPTSGGHQRNLSMPPQIAVEYHQHARQQSQQQVSPQQQPANLSSVAPSQPLTNPFRPGHAHHASLSSIPSYTSPSRYPGGSRPSWQATSAQGPVFPPPVQPSTVIPTSPSSSLQHITFHHWTPNQSKGGAGAGAGAGAGSGSGSTPTTTPSAPSGSSPPASSPKKDPIDEQQLKRRRSISDRPGSPPSRGTTSVTTNSPALSAAVAHSSVRKRGLGHSRHRSEASVLRGGDIQMTRPWSASQPTASFSRFHPTPTTATTSTTAVGTTAQIPEQHSGVNVLASVAAAESDRQQTEKARDERFISPQTEERSRKHNVDFMITQQTPSNGE